MSDKGFIITLLIVHAFAGNPGFKRRQLQVDDDKTDIEARPISPTVHQQNGPECVWCATTTAIRHSAPGSRYQKMNPSWEVTKNGLHQFDVQTGQRLTTVNHFIHEAALKHGLDARMIQLRNLKQKDKAFAFVHQWFAKQRGSMVIICNGEHWFWFKEYLNGPKSQKDTAYTEQTMKRMQTEDHDVLENAMRHHRLDVFRGNHYTHSMVIFNYNPEEEFYEVKNSNGQTSGFEKLGRDVLEDVWTRDTGDGTLFVLAKQEELDRDEVFKDQFESNTVDIFTEVTPGGSDGKFDHKLVHFQSLKQKDEIFAIVQQWFAKQQDD